MMDPEKLQLWILDALWEDNYSFVEMKDYMTSTEVSPIALTQSLMQLFDIGYIGVTFLSAGETFSEREFRLMEFDEQKKSIKDFIKIAQSEEKKISHHYFEISDAGIEHYNSLGFG